MVQLYRTGASGSYCGGDRDALYEPLLQNQRDFINRMDGTRDLIYQEEKARSLRLAYGCRLPHKKSIVKIIKGKEAQFKLRYGFVPAQLPDIDHY